MKHARVMLLGGGAFLSAGVFALLSFSLSGIAANAAPPALCDFSLRIKALEVVQKSSAGSEQELIRKELQARKTLLGEILDCAQAETKELGAALKGTALPQGEIRLEELRRQFGDQLAEAAGFYENQKARISDLGLWGSKDLARTVLEWRASNFASLKEGITSFLLWLKNQELFHTADERLSGIARVIKTRGMSEREDILPLLDEAEENVRRAEAANAELKKRFTERDIPHDVFQRIKASLDPLASAYEIFFKLSEAITPGTGAGENAELPR